MYSLEVSYIMLSVTDDDDCLQNDQVYSLGVVTTCYSPVHTFPSGHPR